jgi:S-adenosylmethionine synthetase
VAGEITTIANIDHEAIIRKTVLDIGYDGDAKYFDGNNCAVVNLLHKQSPDIAQGVDTGGAGDQGIMYGYASNETPSFMPLPIYLAHNLAKKLSEVRKDGTLSYLYPDGKTQVTVEYDGHTPLRVDAVVVSSQHAIDVTQEEIQAGIKKYVIEPVL